MIIINFEYVLFFVLSKHVFKKNHVCPFYQQWYNPTNVKIICNCNTKLSWLSLITCKCTCCDWNYYDDLIFFFVAEGLVYDDIHYYQDITFKVRQIKGKWKLYHTWKALNINIHRASCKNSSKENVKTRIEKPFVYKKSLSAFLRFYTYIKIEVNTVFQGSFFFQTL